MKQIKEARNRIILSLLDNGFSPFELSILKMNSFIISESSFYYVKRGKTHKKQIKLNGGLLLKQWIIKLKLLGERKDYESLFMALDHCNFGNPLTVRSIKRIKKEALNVLSR